MKNFHLQKLLCGVFSALMLLSLTACLDSNYPKKEEYDPPEASSTQKEETFGLNETAVFDDLKITATEFKESNGESFFEPESGNIFVGINFTIENISDEEQSISSLLLFDAYADDISYDLSFTASCAFDGSTIDGTIAPGKKLAGWYAVEIPQSWSTLELNVKSDWLSNTSAVFVFNK